MKKLEFNWMKRKDGTSEFEEFLNSLPDKDAEKLFAVIKKTEDHGLRVAIKMQWVKKLEDNLYELRSRQGPDIQRAIYFQEIGTKFLITHGFSKKSQKTPKQEIQHAQELRRRYLEAKDYE